MSTTTSTSHTYAVGDRVRILKPGEEGEGQITFVSDDGAPASLEVSRHFAGGLWLRPDQVELITPAPEVQKTEAGEDGIRAEKVLITERNAGGQCVREVVVERITEDGSIRQTTVREVEYDTETATAKWETPRAVSPDRATAYIEECYERELLTRPGEELIMPTMFDEIRSRHATEQDAARELGRGLMRGDRASFKLGWSWENSALAAIDAYTLDDDDIAELRCYLLGYAVGLSAGGGDEMGERMLARLPQPEEFRAAYTTGKHDGRQEQVGVTYPDVIETAAARRQREREELLTMRECGCGATTEGECCAAVEGYFTSLGQRSEHELRELHEGDGCEAARILLVKRAGRDS
jgi:hypothetical protein